MPQWLRALLHVVMLCAASIPLQDRLPKPWFIAALVVLTGIILGVLRWADACWRRRQRE
ncbi:hypothetical protein [Stenotrophomonas panacihumi]|uniref:hypothetical protein n=1 Tax=Stenotrophomonas panacihumi TaxID=676599 RepID=UPI000AF6ADC4|nr:hypothetical protein [Stenotrophomonas panacihumi]